MNGTQCKLARVALGWGVRELAKIAGVSTQTVSRFERGDLLKENTVATIKLVFEEAGIEFLPENENGYGIWVNNRRRLGSGLVNHSQKITAAAMHMLEKKA